MHRARRYAQRTASADDGRQAGRPPLLERSTALFRQLAAALRRLEELTMGRGPTA
ncbi:MAG TPA: hypothetical protein VKZ49_03315 [Polyangiaceae bacterium]|nr:hypothetical protein [Polyangiaceae bacterium]